jgi:long-chain acyl-CoA synthetase
MVDVAAACGMLSAIYAAEKPDLRAIISPKGDRTFGALHANANRLANGLRGAGLKPGDGVALMCSNRAEFVEAVLAALRVGLRITPVNWHLTADEAGYIVADCQAKALIVEAPFAASFAEATAPRVRLSIGAAPGFETYETFLAEHTADDPSAPELGTIMLYTSGTTGRPKGVFRRAPEIILPQGAGTFCAYEPARDVNLCAGPAYHAAPLLFDVRWPLASGVPIVLMPKWESAEVLALIAQHRVTHAHMAPIMFHRLLALPEEVRANADCSSLRTVFHGAAPCPIAVKRAMIAWWGPILWEYYAASEGGAGIHISAPEWLAKPGSVGRRPSPTTLKILREDGTEAGVNEDGLIYLQASGDNPFEYFGAPEKTRDSHKAGYFTLGDVGRLDADDYLFLTGRTAECIISGGVNIYPQEIDDVLSQHPAVADCCAIGAPNTEWGEEVRAVVELRSGYDKTDALAAELLGFVQARLSGFKCPRAVDFADALPRLPSGKIQRAKVRAPYWHGRETAI